MEDVALDKLLNNFDFETVHNYMKMKNWEWYNSETRSMQVPSLHEIKETAAYVLRQSYKINGSVQTGGFVATCRPTKTGKLMELFFSIASDFFAINNENEGAQK